MYVGSRRPPISRETMMVVAGGGINSRRAPRKKLSAKRLWRVVRSKRSAMTASTTLLRLFEPHPPMPQMRTFLRLFFPTDAYRCPLGDLLSDRILWRFPPWFSSFAQKKKNNYFLIRTFSCIRQLFAVLICS